MLTRLTVVIFSQYIQISIHYIVFLKLIQCYMSITPLKKRNVYTTISESCLPFLSCICVLVDRDRNSVGAQSLKWFLRRKRKTSLLSYKWDPWFLVSGCLFVESEMLTREAFRSHNFCPSRNVFGEGNGNPLQYSCLENSVDRGAWWAAVHGVTQSWTRLKWLSMHALEKEMATHSSILAWRIPGTGEPGGLPSMGLHRVGHDWSDLAAAAGMS